MLLLHPEQSDELGPAQYHQLSVKSSPEPLCSFSTIRFRQGEGVQTISRKAPKSKYYYKISEGIKRYKNCYSLPIFFIQTEVLSNSKFSLLSSSSPLRRLRLLKSSLGRATQTIRTYQNQSIPVISHMTVT